MTSSVSVPAAKLRDMLAAVIPHAAAEDPLPALEAVRFEVREGALLLVATDRYSVAVARCRIPLDQEAPEPDADALLLLEDADDLARMLERASDPAELVFGDISLSVDAGNASATYGLAPADLADYPDWRPLLSAAIAGDPVQLEETRGINPVHLAKFAVPLSPLDSRQHATSGLRVCIMRPRNRKEAVALFTREDWFLGALMPMRLERDEDYTPGLWAEWAAVTAPAEKPELAEACTR